MNILITGSAGRIGSAIYHLFKAQAHQVIGLDRLASPTTDWVCDLLEIKSHQKQLKEIDVIIHCAALHAPHIGQLNDQLFHDLNVQATLDLIAIAAQFKLKHFIFTSTTALYGYASTQINQCNWITEKTTPLPRTIYHRTKLQAEVLLEQFSKDSGIPVTVLQISRCFPEPVNLMAVYRLHRGIDARDVASAHWAAVSKNLKGFTRLIISAHTPFEPNDATLLYHQASLIIKSKCPKLFKHFSNQDWELPNSIDRVYDATAAMNTLNWQSLYGFDAVIRQFSQNADQVLPYRS